MSFDINSVPSLDTAFAHAFAGMSIALAAALFVPDYLALLIALGFAFGKETLEATGLALWEPKQTWSSSLIDVSQFGYGIAAAAVVLLIKKFW
jgi:hypothetical protein